MRTLTLPLLMAALTATASEPGKMLVVVHTTDRVIINYVCSRNGPVQSDNPVVGTYVQANGGYDWHVVGGVAPYTVLKNEMRTLKSGCITVMDAEGTIATGCGMIGVQQESRTINCGEKEDLNIGPYGLVPNDSTDKARTGWQTSVPPTEGAYVPPVKVPLGDVEPPVDPPSPITTRKTQHRRPSTGTTGPTPVDRKAVHPMAPSKQEGTGHGPKNGATAPGRTSARPQMLSPNKVR